MQSVLRQSLFHLHSVTHGVRWTTLPRRSKVSMASIKALRERTGAPIKAVKEALEATSGDGELALDHLRKLGAALVSKRAQRVANEGLISVYISPCGKRGSIVELSCETDFVARTPQFATLAHDLAITTLSIQNNNNNEDNHNTSVLESLLSMKEIENKLHSAATALGEKIEVGRLNTIDIAETTVTSYIHRGVDNEKNCGKIGVLVALENEDNSNVGNRVAMHIAAASPGYVNTDSVPQEDIEKEREILLESARQEAVDSGKPKPDKVLEKIVDGRIQKWLAEVVLERQEMLVEEEGYQGKGRTLAKSIGAARVVDFVRYEVGKN